MASTPTSSETVTSNIPAWAQKYATDLLGFGAALTFPKLNPATGKLESGFTPYGGELVAGFTPLQERAMGDLSQMQVAPQLGQATGFTGLAALQAQNLAKYDPLKAQQYYQSAFDQPGGLDKYMSPYMQGVVEQQKRGAVQDYARQIPGMRTAAARAGALGGTRDALMRSEGQRNLQSQLQGIQATGLQSAFQNAQQQAAQDAQMRAQYGLAGTQLAEQSRQFGAGLGLQGLEQQRLAAKQLADIGGQQYEQQKGILDAQMRAGQTQQALNQQRLASNYQRFIDEQQYPYKQLEFFSNLLRGTPAGDTTKSLYTQGPNLFSQIYGGLGGLFGGSTGGGP